MTPLKSQIDIRSPFSSLKGKIHQKYFKYQYTIQVLEAEKSWGLPRPHFRLLSDYLVEYDAICKTDLAC
jgi:hypothetical protein